MRIARVEFSWILRCFPSPDHGGGDPLHTVREQKALPKAGAAKQ